MTSLYIAVLDDVCGVDRHLSITVTSLYIAGRDEVYGVDGHLSITVTSLYIAGRDEGRGVDGHLSITVTSASDTRTFVIPRVNTKTFGERSFSYAGPSVWNNLPQTLLTLILPPLSKPPSRRSCLIIISKLFFSALPIPSSDTLCVCVCVCG